MKVSLRPARLPPGVIRYAARSGDTLSHVAARFGLPMLDLVSANLELQSLDRLATGEVLRISTGERGLIVKVKPGENLRSVVARYGASAAEVARANDLHPPDLARVGGYLLLPGVRARGHLSELQARRERDRVAAVKRQKLAQYTRYLAFVREKERRQAQARREQAIADAQKIARTAGPNLRTATGLLRRAAYTGGNVSWPMRNFRLTSAFGERDIPFHREVYHTGIDLAAPFGAPIFAATDGVVTQSGPGDYGLSVWMADGNATVIYGHMSRAAVSAGARVRRGQVLGFVGCTGICTGPHLHFEVRVAGVPVDPIGLLP